MTRIYATLRKRYTTEALKGMGFVKDGGLMVKRGAMRRIRAQASSLDGAWWRVTARAPLALDTADDGKTRKNTRLSKSKTRPRPVALFSLMKASAR